MSLSPSPKPIIGLTSSFCTHATYKMRLAGVGLRYISAIYAAGGLPVVLPSDAPVEEAAYLLERIDGLLLTGGGDIAPERYGGQPHPKVYGTNAARDALEIALANAAVERGVPFLGICRGIQVLNVALGGTLYEDLADQFPHALRHRSDPVTEREMLAHGIKAEKESRLVRLLGETEFEVNSLHHQGIRDVAAGLKVSAWAPDGLVEAVELPDHPFGLAVQWHPEWLYQEHPLQQALFCGLVGAAAAHRG